VRRSHSVQKGLILLCVIIALGGGWLLFTRRLPRQVVVAGITVSLDNRQQFDAALDELEEQALGQTVYIITDDQVWEVTGLDLGVRIDRDAMWESVHELCPRDIFPVRFWRSCQVEGPLHLVVDQSLIRDYLARLGALYWQAPQNAAYDSPESIRPEKPGRVLDINVTADRVLSALQNAMTTVVAQTDVIAPAVSQTQLSDFIADHHLASYTTYFDVANTGRVANITAAAAMLDGYILEPGVTFSFNQVVGPRTLERGFHIAEEIINQELVPGVGGGVCQASSTLYNAALLSGLEIVYRRPHSKPLGYVPIGRDATVYYDVIDLRFRNPYPFSIAIRAKAQDNALRISILAPEPIDVSYEVVVTDITQLPFQEQLIPSNEVPYGYSVLVQAGQTGWVGRTWRVAYDTLGREVFREQISHDIYPAKPVIFQVHPDSLTQTEEDTADYIE
jgi:vancomycin resistance protein YoaR